jgi:hypothetical protein
MLSVNRTHWKGVLYRLSLTHTVNWTAIQWRQLDSADNKRNVAEYEGYLEVEDSYVQGLIALVSLLLDDVTR